MCISAEVSISGFIVCSVTCLYLYKRNKLNDRWIAITFGYIGIVQLLEYLMWIDQECSGLNQIATDLSFYFVILQPIVSLLVAYYMIKKIPWWILLILMFYIIYSVPLFYLGKQNNQCSKPCKGSDIGLSWEWANKDGYLGDIGILLAISIPFLSMKKNGLIYFSFIVGTYIISYFIAKDRCKYSPIISSTSGSLWCLMAVGGPILAVFINK